ncbi:2,3-diaminopropionate biosynthesis protein SbnA [Thalassomonas viridans]|uniref:cysteine synthase n=1 Tax=Thalassomonas viridans TaxID=137584 RepID=A0AAF0CDJ6_9GAMM|nr:2,3-diaminopropionate biosynthesis protein SbnA [Thalassomonas viridans]WDE09253.1 2,3-diaminopropionate biosynthesis protein SbnA [Thalassomonas viridans]
MLLSKLDSISSLVGNTQVLRIDTHKEIDIFAKLEFNGLSNSIKDRAAYNILYQGILNGKITRDSTIVESSSGNLAVSLAAMCQFLGIRFIPVIDKNINRFYETKLAMYCEQVIKITERDHTGGYLLNRLAKVEQLLGEIPGSVWTNQYENEHNRQAYYDHMAPEIISEFEELDYLFVACSTGGTITGLSTRLKAHYPNLKVIAVDIEGSTIFTTSDKKRFVSGLGASLRTKHFDSARIDDYIIVSHQDIIDGCHRLRADQAIMAGASSGANYSAIGKYIERREISPRDKVLFLVHDSGEAYIDTIYNKQWAADLPALMK